MEKGSILNNKELKRTAIEFIEKLEVDPYQPGIIHPNICGDDISEILDDLLWIRNFKEVTFKIIKEDNNLTVSAEIIERKK